MTPVVQLKGITHAYLGIREASLALEDLNLSIGQGEFVSLVGPSGCGKTTLLSIIAGLLQPTRGEVLLKGQQVTGPSPEVGYMLQQDYLFPWRSILDNAVLGLELTGRLNEETREKTLDLLEEMGLAGKGGQYPSQHSGGMRQRVALVRTLATNPSVLLLDEPFSALDYQIKLQLEDLVSETFRHRGSTAILVTHDLAEAIAVSSTVILLEPNPGKIRKVFTVPDEIRDAPPLDARNQKGFIELFNEVWKEMELAGGKADE